MIVEIPDPLLADELRIALGLPPDAPLHRSELRRLTRLHAPGNSDKPDSGRRIRDLTGLEHCEELEELNLNFHFVRDAGPLRSLRSLRRLSLAWSDIADPSFLQDLDKLAELNLAWNAIETPGPLPDLALLRHLNLEGVPLEDLGWLKALDVLNLSNRSFRDFEKWPVLKSLKVLFTCENEISDLRFLEKYPNLEALDLSENAVEDLAVLAKLPELTKLNLRDNPFQGESLGKLKGLRSLNLNAAFPEEFRIPDCPLLEELYLSRPYHEGSVRDLKELSRLSGLRRLDLYGHEIKEITFLTGFRHIEFLELGYNEITDLSPLASLTSLRILALSGNKLQDITPLQGLVNLEALKIDLNDISHIAPLTNLKKLKQLDASSNPIRDAAPLGELHALEGLSIAFSEITDVTPILDLTGLRRLNISEIKNIAGTALSRLAGLESLDAAQTKMGNLSLDLPALKKLNVSYNGFVDFTTLAALRELRELTVNGAGIRDCMPLLQLKRLRVLDLSGSRIRKIAPLSGFATLLLRTLSLEDCKLDLTKPESMQAVERLTEAGIETNYEIGNDFNWEDDCGLPLKLTRLVVTKQGREYRRKWQSIDKHATDPYGKPCILCKPAHEPWSMLSTRLFLYPDGDYLLKDYGRDRRGRWISGSEQRSIHKKCIGVRLDEATEEVIFEFPPGKFVGIEQLLHEDGISGHGDLFCPYNDLKQTFGPRTGSGDPAKTTVEWNLVVDDVVLSIYNYKDDSLYQWRIGGHGPEAVKKVASVLKARNIDAKTEMDSTY